MYIGTGENYGYQFSLNGVNVKRVTRECTELESWSLQMAAITWTKSLWLELQQ